MSPPPQPQALTHPAISQLSRTEDNPPSQAKDREPSRIEKRLLTLVILFGFVLRVSTILWGTGILPYTGRYHPDEAYTVQHAAEFPGNYGRDTNFLTGSTVPYLVAVLVLPAKPFLGPKQWELACLLAMRLLSVLAGTGAILLIYRLARHLYDGSVTALLAAAFTAVSFTHCMNSSFAALDIFVSFFILACFLALFRAIESRQLGDFILLGVLTGILLGTKTSTIVFLGVMPALAMIDIVRARSEAAATARRWLKWLVITNATAFIIFALTTPSVLLHFSAFLSAWREAKSHWYDRTMVPWSGVIPIWWRSSVLAFGMPTMIAFFAGAVFLPSRNRDKNLIILGFILFWYLFHRHHLYLRFVASVAPLICLYAAQYCASLLKVRSSLFRIAGAGLAAVILGVSIWGCVFGIHLRFNDPRDRAARWLKDHTRPETTVGFARTDVPGSGNDNWELPSLQGLDLKVVPAETRPDLIVMGSRARWAMMNALQSPKVNNWIYDPNYKTDWFGNIAPSPETFKLFDELIGETGQYRVEEYFTFTPDFEVDFIAGVRIYRRVTSTTLQP
jgi:4-amino-4-deoxy-L-arabinose transferase-like glycosyltransferase